MSKPSPPHRALVRSCPHLPALRPARPPCSPQVSDVERLLRKYAAELPQVRGCPACCTARRPALAAKARAATSAPPPLRAAANTNGGRSIPHRTASTTDTAARCCCGCPCRLAVSSRLCGARRAAGRGGAGEVRLAGRCGRAAAVAPVAAVAAVVAVFAATAAARYAAGARWERAAGRGGRAAGAGCGCGCGGGGKRPGAGLRPGGAGCYKRRPPVLGAERVSVLPRAGLVSAVTKQSRYSGTIGRGRRP